MNRSDRESASADVEFGDEYAARHSRRQRYVGGATNGNARQHEHAVVADAATRHRHPAVAFPDPRLFAEHRQRIGGDLLECHDVRRIPRKDLGDRGIALRREVALEPDVEGRHGQFVDLGATD